LSQKKTDLTNQAIPGGIETPGKGLPNLLATKLGKTHAKNLHATESATIILLMVQKSGLTTWDGAKTS